MQFNDSMPDKESNSWHLYIKLKTGVTIDVDELIKDYVSGKSLESIAKTYGCSATKLRHILVAKDPVQFEAYKIEHKKNIVKRPVQRQLTVDIKKIVEEYISGKPISEIGKNEGISSNMVVQLMWETGNYARYKELHEESRMKKRIGFTLAEAREVFKEMFLAGKTLKEIGKQHNLDPTRVKKIISDNKAEFQQTRQVRFVFKKIENARQLLPTSSQGGEKLFSINHRELRQYMIDMVKAYYTKSGYLPSVRMLRKTPEGIGFIHLCYTRFNSYKDVCSMAGFNFAQDGILAYKKRQKEAAKAEITEAKPLKHFEPL